MNWPSGTVFAGEEAIAGGVALAVMALSGWWLWRSHRGPAPQPAADGQRQHSAAPLRSDAVDCTLLRYLSDGTPAGLAAQIDRYLEALAKAEARVQSARETGRLAALGDAAHALLSQGRMVNHSGVVAAAQKLEAAAVDARNEQIGGLTAALLQETRQLRETLARARPATPTT